MQIRSELQMKIWKGRLESFERASRPAMARKVGLVPAAGGGV
jgi:hypothetical protein